MPAPVILLDIPLFLELPVPDDQGQTRNLLIVASIRLHDGTHLRVDVSWNEMTPPPPIPPTRSTRAGVMRTPTIPDVHVIPPGDFMGQPIYVRIDKLPGLILPNSLLVGITVTEWIPGVRSSMGIQSDIKYITNMASVTSPPLVVSRSESLVADEPVREEEEDRGTGWA